MERVVERHRGEADDVRRAEVGDHAAGLDRGKDGGRIGEPARQLGASRVGVAGREDLDAELVEELLEVGRQRIERSRRAGMPTSSKIASDAASGTMLKSGDVDIFQAAAPVSATNGPLGSKR